MELYLTGCRIWNQKNADTIRVKDGVIAGIGMADAMLPEKVTDAQIVDLHSAAVYPGFVDSHLHILNYAITSREPVLNDLKSREKVLRVIEQAAQKAAPGSEINARGFNQDLWSDSRLPSRHELDQVTGDIPTRLVRVCGHMEIANTAAIRKAGITENTPVPVGGTMDLEHGIFCENAIELLYPPKKDGGVALCKELLFEGLSHAADTGLTAIYSDDIGTGGYSMHTVIQAYKELEQENRMPVRVVEQCALPSQDMLNEFLSSGYHWMAGSDFFRIGPRKLYSDGSLGARTAWISVPYADAPGQKGVPIYTQEEMNELAEASHKAGMPFIVHAIGDVGAETVLNAIEYARKAVPGTDSLPDGIVHCQITTAHTLARIKALNAYIYAQPVFTEYDLHICRDRVGEALEKTSYNWKTIYDSGVCISSGSDCPVEPLDPAKNIFCAVTRKDFDRKPDGGWMPEQKLSLREAIDCHTAQAARAVGYGDRFGQIKVGYTADFSIFPIPFETLDSDDILTQKPVMTVVGGKIRYCAK